MSDYIESYNMGYVETLDHLDYRHPLYNINDYPYDPFLEDKGRFDKIGFLMGKTEALFKVLLLQNSRIENLLKS